jgi:hypothetical protein
MYPESSAIENTRVIRWKNRLFHRERNQPSVAEIAGNAISSYGEAPVLGWRVSPSGDPMIVAH